MRNHSPSQSADPAPSSDRGRSTGSPHASRIARSRRGRSETRNDASYPPGCSPSSWRSLRRSRSRAPDVRPRASSTSARTAIARPSERRSTSRRASSSSSRPAPRSSSSTMRSSDGAMTSRAASETAASSRAVRALRVATTTRSFGLRSMTLPSRSRCSRAIRSPESITSTPAPVAAKDSTSDSGSRPSSGSHQSNEEPEAAAHEATSVVFPAPTGPCTTVTSDHAERRSSSRGRGNACAATLGAPVPGRESPTSITTCAHPPHGERRPKRSCTARDPGFHSGQPTL